MSKLMLGAVCGFSVLFCAAVLPRAQQEPGTPAGDAPAVQVAPAAAGTDAPAPAAKPAPDVLQPPSTIAGNSSLAILELTGSGKLLHVHGGVVAGVGAFKTSIKASMVAPCINGSDPSCSGLITTDADGKAYLFIDTLETWRVATNIEGDGAVTLTGVVDGKGVFTMAGTDAGSEDTQIMITGKLKFLKGTLTPVKISGKITAVSMLQEHAGTGKFNGETFDPEV